MTMKPGLFQGTGLRQELKANPRLYQAMDLLQMPMLELQQRLRTEMESNPFLEMDEPDELLELQEEAEKEQEDEIDWEEILLEGFGSGSSSPSGPYSGNEEWYDPVTVQSRDLGDYLRDQLHMQSLDQRKLLLGEEIIGNINDEGYLSCSLEEVVEGLNDWVKSGEAPEDKKYTLEEAQEMLEVVQGLEPSGVGARTVQESLLIQIRDGKEVSPLTKKILKDYYNELIKHRWNDIAKAEGVSVQEVQAASDQVSKLNPKPGFEISASRQETVLPDLIVKQVEGEYHISLNDSGVPRLQLSRTYRDIAKNKNQFNGENKKFISEKMNSANWLIQTIEQRRQTMLQVMHTILQEQKEFFEKGVQHLRPLTLKEVADQVGVHESTVSRVTSDKYVQTPRGVLPLKFFFSAALSSSEGEDVSARGIKAKIKELIENEDPSSPYTDQEIVDTLDEEGIQVARRTVAKYRNQLGLLSARMRKRV